MFMADSFEGKEGKKGKNEGSIGVVVINHRLLLVSTLEHAASGVLRFPSNTI